jgi:CHAT domain-containing protein
MFGRYGDGSRSLPRVVVLGVSRFRETLPAPGERLEFVVSIHEEGRGLTWRRNVALDAPTEALLLEAATLRVGPQMRGVPGFHAQLLQWGRTLYDVFVGEDGGAYLERLQPTALLLEVDETILNLPWELLADEAGLLGLRFPVGRLVSTRRVPHPGRDPLTEDQTVRVLAVANPSADLGQAEGVLDALRELSSRVNNVDVQVLRRGDATRRSVIDTLSQGDFDIVHFAGHGAFVGDGPHRSHLRLADGELTADDVLAMAWRAPPYFVFGSACESARARPGARLVSAEDHSNGMAAACLAAGVEAYAGFWWEVSDDAAALFASVFYSQLVRRMNVGLAFMDARIEVFGAFADWADPTPYCTVLYGDAASGERRDISAAV